MDQNKTILAVDQSTSATKAVLIDTLGQTLFESSLTHISQYPRPGWVEQDPETLANNTASLVSDALKWSRAHQKTVVALGITNQRETVVVWSKVTGKAVYPAAGWQCLRGESIVASLSAQGLGPLVQKKTGLPLDAHFSASKVSWILSEVPGAKEEAERGNLAFGTVDSWLVFCLTQGRVHATDHSNASRTLLYNLDLASWDPELFKLFGIPLNMAPEIRMSDGDFGHAQNPQLWAESIPIRAVLGDSHAALFGLKCFEPGTVKATYGTGSSVMLNIGPRPPGSKSNSLATSVAWGLGGQIDYVLEGNIHHSGDTLQWMVKDLGLFTTMEEWESLANSTPDCQGVHVVPAFSGLGAPFWDAEARGAILGLTRGCGKAQVARAGLESLAYQVQDLLAAMRGSTGLELTTLSVDGGPTKNPVLMQFQADVGLTTVLVSNNPNASVFGIACVAGLSSRVWPNRDSLKALGGQATQYSPSMDDSERIGRYAAWTRAVQRVLGGHR